MTKEKRIHCVLVKFALCIAASRHSACYSVNPRAPQSVSQSERQLIGERLNTTQNEVEMKKKANKNKR